MIAALDSTHSDRPGVLKGTENDKHEYSDPKTQIYARFMCFFLILMNEIGRKITHYQLKLMDELNIIFENSGGVE